MQAALEVAAEQGVSRITAQSIADRVGIAQPTVFRHFSSVDAIFEAVLDSIHGAMVANLAPVFADQSPPDRRLKHLIARQLRFIAARRGMPRLLFSERLHLDNPRLRERLLKVMGQFGEHVAKLLDEGVAQGVFRRDLDTEQTVRLLIALVQGLVLRWSLSGFTFALDGDEQVEAVWNLMWPALAPTPTPSPVKGAQQTKRTTRRRMR